MSAVVPKEGAPTKEKKSGLGKCLRLRTAGPCWMRALYFVVAACSFGWFLYNLFQLSMGVTDKVRAPLSPGPSATKLNERW